MSAKILDGRMLAISTEEFTKLRAKVLREKQGHVAPHLAVVLTTDDPASRIYVEKKREACQRVGFDGSLYVCRDEWELLRTINQLNRNPYVHGILVQLPLKDGMSRSKVYDVIDPEKDVDCFSPANVGLLLQGRPRFTPPTPEAVGAILNHYALWPSGKNVTIISRSDIVGKPLAAALLRDSVDGNATITVCHDQTDPIDLQRHCQGSDIIVVAVGIPNFLDERHIPQGATVIDVGINRVRGKVVGDVNFEAVKDIAGAITPVPGGVGPCVVACLMHNTLMAYMRQIERN